MSAFTDDQIASLRAPLAREHVKEREQSGRKLSYIEGWTVIAEANRIFGFDAWDRETVECRCVVEREAKIGRPPNQKDGWRVAYVSKVRVTVRPSADAAPKDFVRREGTGYGSGIDADLGSAHESAIKEAETDAMKRALMTFGNPFGLALYDKTQAEVEPVQRRAPASDGERGAGPASQAPANGTVPQTPRTAPLPANPEEPPAMAHQRAAARVEFWRRTSYAIDPDVVSGGMAAWDREFLALAEAAPNLDAYLKLRDENTAHYQRWATNTAKPAVESFNERLKRAYRRVAQTDGVAA